jgi:hypothetical protein
MSVWLDIIKHGADFFDPASGAGQAVSHFVTEGIKKIGSTHANLHEVLPKDLALKFSNFLADRTNGGIVDAAPQLKTIYEGLTGLFKNTGYGLEGLAAGGLGFKGLQALWNKGADNIANRATRKTLNTIVNGPELKQPFSLAKFLVGAFGWIPGVKERLIPQLVKEAERAKLNVTSLAPNGPKALKAKGKAPATYDIMPYSTPIGNMASP